MPHKNDRYKPGQPLTPSRQSRFGDRYARTEPTPRRKVPAVIPALAKRGIAQG